jgi:cell division GTPase FtsZ
MQNDNNKNKKPIHIIGLGGAGSNMVEYIHNKEFQAKFTMVTTPIRTNLPSEINFIEYVSKGIYFGKEGHKVRFSDFSQPVIVPKKLNNFFSNDYHYVLLAGFGGFTGTVLTRELSIRLINNGKSFSVFCTLPFDFEGENRRAFANSVRQKLQGFSNFHPYHLNELRLKYGNLQINEAFQKADEEIYLNLTNHQF